MASLPPMLPSTDSAVVSRAAPDSSNGATQADGGGATALVPSVVVRGSPVRGLGSPAGEGHTQSDEVDRTRKWDVLSDAERSAAVVLGYNPEAWNGALVPPGCCNSVRPTLASSFAAGSQLTSLRALSGSRRSGRQTRLQFVAGRSSRLDREKRPRSSGIRRTSGTQRCVDQSHRQTTAVCKLLNAPVVWRWL